MYMYPQSNSARSVRDLSGVWDFRFNADEPWQPIAVPASYNDQSPDPEFRRHYGMAYYRTTFTVPEGARRALPVGNEGGTAFFGSDNAGIPAVEAGKARQQAQGINLPNFDFFNYAGITRPVHLYTTPAAYIRDVTVAADMTGTLRYTVDTVGEGSVKVLVTVGPESAAFYRDEPEQELFDSVSFPVTVEDANDDGTGFDISFDDITGDGESDVVVRSSTPT